MRLLRPIFVDLKDSDSSQDFTDCHKMVTATTITCCLAKLNVLPKAEYSMALMKQFVLEPDVERRKCVHYDMIDSLLTTPQSRYELSATVLCNCQYLYSRLSMGMFIYFILSSTDC